MFHTRATIKMFGPLSNTSAEAVEKKHVAIKQMFEHTSQRQDTCLQVLVRCKRIDDMMKIHDQLKNDALEEEEEGMEGPAGSMDQGRTYESLGHQTHASFSDNMNSSGRRYPMWAIVTDWKNCGKMLVIAATDRNLVTVSGGHSKAQILIDLDALLIPTSEWNRSCDDMTRLRTYLAMFLRNKYGHVGAIQAMLGSQFQDRLTHVQIQGLCSLIIPWHGSQRQQTRYGSGHLAVYWGLRIKHLTIPGQVLTRVL